MFVIIKEIIPAFSPRAGIDAAVLASLRGLQLAEGPRERPRLVLILGGIFGGGRALGKGASGGLIGEWGARGIGEGFFGCEWQGGEVFGEGGRGRWVGRIEVEPRSVQRFFGKELMKWE